MTRPKSLIDLLAGNRSGLGFSQISEALQLSKADTHDAINAGLRQGILYIAWAGDWASGEPRCYPTSLLTQQPPTDY